MTSSLAKMLWLLHHKCVSNSIYYTRNIIEKEIFSTITIFITAKNYSSIQLEFYLRQTLYPDFQTDKMIQHHSWQNILNCACFIFSTGFNTFPVTWAIFSKSAFESSHPKQLQQNNGPQNRTYYTKWLPILCTFSPQEPPYNWHKSSKNLSKSISGLSKSGCDMFSLSKLCIPSDKHANCSK